MVGVVGGIARAGGALFAGISLIVLTASPTFPLLRNIGWYPNLSGVTPGFMGVGLGRNPNGAVADMREPFEPLGRDWPILGGFLATVAAIYVGVLQLDVGAWWVILGIVIALVVFGQLATMRVQSRHRGPVPEEIEWIGIDRPFTPADAAEFDRQLGVEELV
jgi:hypothetical protein